MYTVCTIRLSEAIDAPFLMPIARTFVFVALAAWLAVATGWVTSLNWKSGKRLRQSHGNSIQ